ncbi:MULTISPECIES: RrF2 family transcriptional regulator [Acinetobacter]|jgi:Rrf2 family nitric oxide-sensitive transcriptional repressor|uniref:HTH-type transcriptional repressor NsrR n=1 Tax=Acinetobacter venetianus TaxID=52133 RepID=A0A137Y2V3_9GAMM|nr:MULTISPECIES: Rrf2 family transcriptional regulator [Acinetobacter]ERQ00057.1 DNA-binding protein [Acinetobacter sp. COS3]KXO80306.1 transcriptional regulator [Acinetobacter venetianus]KXZ68377.1 HTH-type transcriptional repressor NsrR [Acinetobacter venetianus]MBC69076.1 transcriptional regulator [Acinetobacter sp.]MBT49631.1 transcriptional regulator [Acinetobacter sp.]|tara:strand:+ start:1396 stop:1848 length:453 start_codon:yes stop_codon:yes gene_type:complete
MQLNKFTDYALRILLYVARPSDVPYTIADIAKDLHVSQNHLVKVVHFMGKQHWIVTIRGKGGGIRLNPDARNIKLGEIVRILQGNHQIVECNTPPCVLRSQCGLKGILDQALESFYQSLDRYTLGEVLQHGILPSSQSSHIDFLQLTQKA